MKDNCDFFGWPTRWIHKPKIILDHISVILLELTFFSWEVFIHKCKPGICFITQHFILKTFKSLKILQGHYCKHPQVPFPIFTSVNILLHLLISFSLYISPTHIHTHSFTKTLKRKWQTWHFPSWLFSTYLQRTGHSPIKLFYFHSQEFLP